MAKQQQQMPPRDKLGMGGEGSKYRPGGSLGREELKPDALLGPRIEEYVDSDVEDVFEEIAGKLGSTSSIASDIKYTQVRTV